MIWKPKNMDLTTFNKNCARAPSSRTKSKISGGIVNKQIWNKYNKETFGRPGTELKTFSSYGPWTPGKPLNMAIK